MKALVHLGSEGRVRDLVPGRSILEPAEAIPIDSPTAGGTDLHILKGRRSEMITTGLDEISRMPRPLKLVEGGGLDPTMSATHSFPLAESEQAYPLVGAAAESRVLKPAFSVVPIGHRLPVADAEIVGV